MIRGSLSGCGINVVLRIMCYENGVWRLFGGSNGFGWVSVCVGYFVYNLVFGVNLFCGWVIGVGVY